MRKFCAVLAACMGLSLLCSTAVSETSAVAYSRQQLLELAKQMREETKNSLTPEASPLEKHLDASTILAYRNKDGKAELHEQAADVFFVLEGAATLVTGGTIANPATTAPGEIRGSAVQQGSRRDLKEGDIAHIPAGVSHQVLVPRGGSFTYFVVKVPLK